MASVMVVGGTTAVAAAAEPAPAAEQIRLRIGQYNLPGADKLSRSTTRAKRASSLIRRADLDVVVLNELVGPGRDGFGSRPSRFARTVARALGDRWALVTPTTAHNENYVAYRRDRLTVVTQHPDQVVPGTGRGRARTMTSRHVTPVLLEEAASGRRLLVAATHLVNDDRRGARKQAHAVGRIATRLAAGHPVVVAGDMNTSQRLTGLTRAGLKDARSHARARSNAEYATYVDYASRRASKQRRAVIDHVYVPRSWTVRRWTTVVDARRGAFRSPRPSDHLLVWASVTSDGKVA